MTRMVTVKTLQKLLGLSVILFWLVIPATGQTQGISTAESFRYTVQPDDTLLTLAVRYNVRLTTLILANTLPFPQLAFTGQTLTIPGVPPPLTPLDPPAGWPPLRAEPYLVQAGDSLSAIANQFGISLGALMLVNSLTDPDLIQVGQALQIPAGEPVPEPLEAPFQQITLSESVIIQGRTLVVKVRLAEVAGLTGVFEGRPLFFEEDQSGQWWSIIAIHALTEPRIYPVILTATLPDGASTTALTNVTVVEGPYGTENIQLDASRGELLNDALIEQERQKLADLWSQVTPRPLWAGPFRWPVAGQPQFTSEFGTRRSYNGSPVTSFHGGTDFGGAIGTPIYAAAAGTVVMAESLPLRGNAVLIDHGMGLFSGYWHQTQLVVSEGQPVQAGELLGYLGNTGLVTGPHLHWEMRLQGIAVEPLQWVQQTIP